MFDGSTVWKASKWIGERQLLQEPVLGLNLPMKLGNTATYCDPGQQFTWVKRFREIIIGASRQAFDNLVLFGITCEQYDVRVRILILANLFTKLQSRDIGHLP